MRKLFLCASAAWLCCMSCNNENKGGGMSARAQKNLDAAHSINKGIETGDVSKFGDYIAVDGVDHSDMGDVKGLDSIKARLAVMHTVITDMKMTTIKELADDEYVFQWMKMSGNNTDPRMGPVGKMEANAIQVTKFNADSKATEHWEFMQVADMMKMMGSMPMPAGDMGPLEAPKKDSVPVNK